MASEMMSETSSQPDDDLLPFFWEDDSEVEFEGQDGHMIPDFVPILPEMLELVKYWTRKRIETDWFYFGLPGYGWTSRECHEDRRGSLRIKRIENLVGVELVRKAIDEAYEEFGRTVDEAKWRVYLHGTDGERMGLQAENVLRMEAEFGKDKQHGVPEKAGP